MLVLRKPFTALYNFFISQNTSTPPTVGFTQPNAAYTWMIHWFFSLFFHPGKERLKPVLIGRECGLVRGFRVAPVSGCAGFVVYPLAYFE